ncbi:RNA 3'-terminal phosphate cyclase [Sphingomonas sp. CBMAI 2297]|uniref:RNA 3'-terminal phosphate cyclase n=1 Tax=Sphingomonas sp. CBMAI 2297 TaxID=2991720 RepID=UPI0024554175|nr:RNA 3'-terminal phosphate cyclase [Sphingomonas sp. CBMAI 2297]MDH4743922.1 RNA 3'-terminal phosphate cyclase [Sphingomonas sp. CBMAI 2297]
MIIIDGSEGEGGGQIVRNSCALSLVTGQPFRIINTRGKREKPGLMRQHVTAIEAACAIGGATCEGVAVGASDFSFTPGRVAPGEYHFAVGTAGSTGLVLQTVLMPLLLAGGPSRLVLEGGTHNMLAPPFDFVAKAFAPVVRRMGAGIEMRLVRHGFYPRGGGRIEVDLIPRALAPIHCLDRGALLSVTGTALFAALPHGIAERELATARKLLPDWPERSFAVRELPDAQGPGNALLLEAVFEHATEIVTGFGRLGVSAEALAKTAAHRMAGFLESRAFAGPYLADQLLLPFAIAEGGSFTTVKPSQHARTAADVIARFTGQRWGFEQQPDGCHLVRRVSGDAVRDR